MIKIMARDIGRPVTFRRFHAEEDKVMVGETIVGEVVGFNRDGVLVAFSDHPNVVPVINRVDLEWADG